MRRGTTPFPRGRLGKGNISVTISWFKRVLTVGTAVVATGTWLAAAAPPAHAVGDVIAESGSDAASKVMTAVLQGTGAYNVPAQSQLTGDYTVPTDSYCSDVTYNSTGTGTDSHGNPKIVAPLGAGQGQTALDGSVAKTYPGSFAYAAVTSSVGGCIDIARLASKSSNSSDQSYGYAVDAVGWGTPSLNAPASLTLQDLRDIWLCNINDWSQVPGGSSGPIVRALPPFGGGTRRFFLNNVLGISSETSSVAWNPPTSGVIPAGHPGAGSAVTCPGVATVSEQSNGNALLAPALRADYQKYIVMYDAGNWVFQANGAGNPTLDIRGGVRPGGIVGVASSGSFPAAYGVRWTGTAWRLNDGTILGTNESGARSQSGVTSGGVFATTLTGAPGTFLTTDVGLNIQATFLNEGTAITAINGDGSQATISPPAKAAGSGAATIGWAVVSEKNPSVTNTSSIEYPGVRELFNAVNPNSPSYTAARNLVGYDDTATNGTVSALCNGSDASIIEDFGFLSLNSIDPTGPGIGNDNAVTCRKV